MGPTFRILGGIIFFIIFFTFLLTPGGLGQELSNYLILNDINGFRASKNPSSGQGPGVLAGAGHFYEDHKDMTYRISYFNLETRVGPSIQVTQHAGSDSDKWLLHEVERGFRDPKDLEARPSEDTMIREINGYKIFFYGGGVVGYRWVTNNIVVNIQYSNLGGLKPEPLEVVQAYLQKLPSTIPPTLVLDRAHDEQWIKDEMERRLWLCDKWFLHFQAGKSELYSTLRTVVDHMFVFLDYREKYYGMKGMDEKKTLNDYLIQRDGTSIKNKLAEYKTWWNVNKTRPINLP